MDAVGANHQIKSAARSIRKADRRLVAPQLNSVAAPTQMYAFRRQTILQSFQQVGPMNGQLRRAVFFFCGIGHLQARGFLAREPVTADPVGWSGGGFADVFPDTQLVESKYGIRSQVDIRADPIELRRLLEHIDLMAHLAQGNRRGKSTDAASANADSECCQIYSFQRAIFNIAR